MFGPVFRKVQRGSTSKSVFLRFGNQISMVPQLSISDATSGLTLVVERLGSTYSAVSFTAVSLANLSSSFNAGGTTSMYGGIKAIDQGWCRVDIPDAIWADGGPSIDSILISASATAIVSGGCIVDFVAYDPFTNLGQSTPEVY